MKTRILLIAAVPLGLVAGLAGARFADPVMQDRATNPYGSDHGEQIVLQEAPRQPVYSIQPQDLDPRGGYRPDLDYDAEVWDSDMARMEAERRAFHIDDYYEDVEAPAPSAPVPAPQPELAAADTSAASPHPKDTDGLAAIY